MLVALVALTARGGACWALLPTQASENLAFYDAVEEYERNAARSGHQRTSSLTRERSCRHDRQAAALAVVDRFVRTGSEQEVNLSSAQRAALVGHADGQDALAPVAFGPAKEEIRDLHACRLHERAHTDASPSHF